MPDLTIARVAKDFGVSETCLQNWLRKAGVEDGNRSSDTPEEE